jgi:hypothetical protein
MTRILYVYAIGRRITADELTGVSGVDGTSEFGICTRNDLSAVYSNVAAHEFSQAAIDARASDLEWLGAIGYAHQKVNERLAERATIVPLRAFTLFSSSEALNSYLATNHDGLEGTLERLQDRSEWTLRFEFDHDRWSSAVIDRVESLKKLVQEAEIAPAGKAYLLKKKLDDERKKAAKEAEESLVREVESRVRSMIDAELLTETRQTRAGSFPQINLLAKRTDTSAIESIERQLTSEYASDGVRFVLTGPWPAYSFAGGAR